MGCGASRPGALGPTADNIEFIRDPDDYGQEFVELQASGISEFDEVFTQVHLNTSRMNASYF